MKFNKCFLPIMLSGLFVILCTACGLTSSGHACGDEDSGLCTEFTGSVYTESMVKSQCEFDYLSNGCPTADVVGKCYMNKGGLNEFVVFYYLSNFTAVAGQEGCEALNGVWE